MGVAVGEDAAVLGDEPVAAAVRSRGHADDGLVQLQRTSGAVESGATEAEDAAIGGDLPIALWVEDLVTTEV